MPQATQRGPEQRAGCRSATDVGIQQGGTPCVDTGGSAQRPRGLPGLWSERAAFMASPLGGVGKGGLQSGEASPPGTQPNRRTWNGQPAFASAKCPYVGADAILTQVKTGPYRLLTTPALATICIVDARFSGFPACQATLRWLQQADPKWCYWRTPSSRTRTDHRCRRCRGIEKIGL